MTLDEAIKHAEKVMVENLEKTKDRNASDPIAINCFECADEHRQLAEWLKDYKRLLEQEPKTGHWIKTISENGITSSVRCSECGFEDNRYMLFRYCPNCRARMESEDKECLD